MEKDTKKTSESGTGLSTPLREIVIPAPTSDPLELLKILALVYLVLDD